MTQTSDMQAYREYPEDVERVARLFTLVPDRGSSALDVGARDGYLSLMLAERFERVVALDLSAPTIEHPRKSKLRGLMTGLEPAQTDFVGRTRAATNALSSRLLQFAGNPYGTYHQDEPCLYCERPLLPPTPRTLPQKVATKLATWDNDVQGLFTPWQSNWIHMRFDKQPDRSVQQGIQS